LQISNKEKHKT